MVVHTLIIITMTLIAKATAIILYVLPSSHPDVITACRCSTVLACRCNCRIDVAANFLFRNRWWPIICPSGRIEKTVGNQMLAIPKAHFLKRKPKIRRGSYSASSESNKPNRPKSVCPNQNETQARHSWSPAHPKAASAAHEHNGRRATHGWWRRRG